MTTLRESLRQHGQRYKLEESAPCIDCGHMIDPARLAWAKKKGIVMKRCAGCSAKAGTGSRPGLYGITVQNPEDRDEPNYPPER